MLRSFKVKPEKIIEAIWSCDTKVMTINKIETLLGLSFFGIKKD